jgi:hypothetical protein
MDLRFLDLSVAKLNWNGLQPSNPMRSLQMKQRRMLEGALSANCLALKQFFER